MFTFDFVVHTQFRSLLNSLCFGSFTALHITLKRNCNESVIHMHIGNFLVFLFLIVQKKTELSVSKFNFISLSPPVMRGLCPLRSVSTARLKHEAREKWVRKKFVCRCTHISQSFSCIKAFLFYHQQQHSFLSFFSLRFVSCVSYQRRKKK